MIVTLISSLAKLLSNDAPKIILVEADVFSLTSFEICFTSDNEKLFSPDVTLNKIPSAFSSGKRVICDDKLF